MHFKTLAVAAILANFCVLASAEAASLYNSNSSSDGGGAATPVFIETPRAEAPAVSSNLYTNSGSTSAVQTPQPKATPMSDSEYAAYAQSIARQNASVGAQRSAQVNANFQQVADQNAQMAAAKKAAQTRGGGDGAAQGAKPVDPYAGRTVIFTGGKKTDEDKPTRLFNVQ